jgi:hypothetical protein
MLVDLSEQQRRISWVASSCLSIEGQGHNLRGLHNITFPNLVLQLNRQHGEFVKLCQRGLLGVLVLVLLSLC